MQLFLFQVEAIYLISEGNSSDGAREVLRTTVEKIDIPLHIVSYECSDPSALVYLKSIADISGRLV